MATTVRTIDFLPEIFKTKTNEQFLSATLDQLTQQPDFSKVQGFIGSKFGYGVNSTDAYVAEPNAVRTNYQLEPAVVFKKKDTNKAVDVLTYPGLIDAVALEGGVTKNNNNLFNNEFYSWDSFVDLDKLINYNQYYWLPNGPEALTLGTVSIYMESVFDVTLAANGFTFVQNEIPVDGTSPIITLVRGGTYTFNVNQESNFWIQTQPNISGVDATHNNISTREVFGVENNGENVGTITFTVPKADAQNEYLVGPHIDVDLVSELPFEQINGARLNDLKGIDGVSDLDGKTLLFYGTLPGTQAFINDFFDVDPFGGAEFDNTVQFEQGAYTTINNHYYQISIVGDTTDPIVKLTEAGYLQNDERISILSGATYTGRDFIRNSFFEIELIPSMTAGLDTLYYRDGTNPLKVGKIKLVDSAGTEFVNVNDIIGAKTYTSPNGITLTNGLKVQFLSNAIPEEYRKHQYYVEGVGDSIKLIPVSELVVPELYSHSYVTPYDSGSFDTNSFGSSVQVPVDQDYITINRSALNRNAWSRSNRWFHEDVLKLVVSSSVRSPNTTAALNDPNARAKRPIIEFYPNLKLMKSGSSSKKAVDFINFTATNALSEVAGQESYEPDGSGSSLFEGARIVFANDSALNVRNKIYIVNFVMLTGNTNPVISLSVAPDGNIQYDEQVVSTGGIDNKAKTIYFDGSVWHYGQYKATTNQTPLFDVFDANNVSFGDSSFYPGTDFVGSTLFQYAPATGTNDPVLRFPIKYSSISNLGDITFENTLNTDTFNYVDGSTSKTVNIGTGYVYNYSSRNTYTREIGWKTAVEKSFQYQVFEFTYTANSTSQSFKCDVAALSENDTKWAPIVVYVDNNRTSNYTTTVDSTTTTITVTDKLAYGTPIQVMIYSNQASATGYYQIPDNLEQNPFNQQITMINLGEIRGHYKSICNNVRNLTGTAFGANNYRDLGNVVPYGTRIIQNSSPLPIASTFLRGKDVNFFNSIEYNSREYIKFKSLLIDTIDRLDLNSLQDNASILDTALDKVSTSKLETNPFFWTDMLPQGAAPIVNQYTFKLGGIPSVYLLSKVYDFKSANYDGLLVYLTRKIAGINRVTQLIKDIDYTVSSSEKSLVLLRTDIEVNDILTIKEYTQTYGSYVPNTPTKLGLYPLFKPEVVYDETYVNPGYFIKGHDGSYTKLFGEYNDGYLEDFRDKALIEFETRIFNNIKVDAKIPVEFDDLFPGQFRETNFTSENIQQVYNTAFLNWVGANRVEYKTQYFVNTDEYTWNYNGAINKLTNSPITQGNWKGLYLWMFDTTTPHITPWEMLGLSLKPSWWDTRYGAAPYTSDNDLLWTDISNGYVWNNNNPYTNEKRKRPGLLSVLPVNSAGELVLPIESTISSYNIASFNNNWVVGDLAPTEFSYRKSSSWPFDFIRMCALLKPAQFFTLGYNLDAYRYNTEFKQYLVKDRFRDLSNYAIQYGTNNTTGSHSYLNWIVDYQRQYGVVTTSIFETLKNLDVRLTYRVAGFSDKDMLKFFVEKGSPNSKNSSLLIPDESYSILLYDNQTNDVITYSSVIVQRTTTGYKIYGNSQRQSFFTALNPINNGNYETISVNGFSVQLAKNYSTVAYKIPYGTEFSSANTLSEFLKGYGMYLESQGMIFNDIENGLELSWNQMISETLYWIQSGWEVGSTVNVNPCANSITVNKESNIVQPLTIHHDNFVLNQNLIPIQLKDMSIFRNGTLFSAKALNQGDSISFFTARLSTIEHVVVFDNLTLFNDSIFNVITGLRQQRLYVKGTKSVAWNGSMNASGFIINQDNITEWVENQKYTKGSIVTYKNSYWVAKDKSAPPSAKFDTTIWVKTNYDNIQKGLLPNPSTRAYESTLYYDANRANLETDGDLLSFSLIGYRPRDYLAQGDLDDSTQVNVYQNMLGSKGTNIASTGLNGVTVQHNPLDYAVYENWAIKTGEYGGILNQNFIEVTLDELALKGNPSIVSVVKDTPVTGAEQQINLRDIKNYGRILGDDNILTTIDGIHDDILPGAGYVNLDDVYATAYTVDRLDNALIADLYKNDYIWVADTGSTWEVYTPLAMQINLVTVINNLNGTVTFVFDGRHSLSKNDPFGVLNFDARINGFYTVKSIVDINTVVVTKDLNKSVNTISSSGLAFKLQSQRVGTGKDINYLSLLQNEYAREKVWVDVGTTGQWLVYEKSNNYKDSHFSRGTAGVAFGYSTAYVPALGYFLADPGANVVHHYKKFGDNFVAVADITPPAGHPATTFGVSMCYADKFLVIGDSNPDSNGTSNLFIYRIVNEKLLQTLVLEQVMDFPGAGRFGDVVTMSRDGNIIYATLLDYGIITTFVQSEQLVYERITDNIDHVSMKLSVDTELNTNHFTVDGDWASDSAHKTISQGKYVAFDNIDEPMVLTNASVYTILSARYDSSADKTTFYTVETFDVVYSADTYVLTGSYFFNTWTTTDGYVYPLSPDDWEVVQATTGYGFSLATNNDGSTLVIGEPYRDSINGNEVIQSTGAAYVSQKLVETFEMEYDGTAGQLAVIYLAAHPTDVTAFIYDGSIVTRPISFVYLNGRRLTPEIPPDEASGYPGQLGDYLFEDGSIPVMLLKGDLLKAGDIITVMGLLPPEPAELRSYDEPSQARPGELFGYSVDCNPTASEIIVGVPFDGHNLAKQEGSVHRFTNEGKKFGTLTGLGPAALSVVGQKNIFINGFPVKVSSNDAAGLAEQINQTRINNVYAYATDDGRLVISLRDNTLGQNNNKLNLTVTNNTGAGINYWDMLHIYPYIRTQVITDQHKQNRAQFGFKVKFNEFNSFAVSAPVATRYVGTTFDFSDDENSHNDAVFDNNLTQWEDVAPNAGAVYMYDYVPTYNESLFNISEFVYAQSCNDTTDTTGAQAYYGSSLSFNDYTLIIGVPGFMTDTVGGKVVIYNNAVKAQNWSTYRKATNVVDINKIQKVQMYNNINNTMMESLDYFDPSQGKLLGAIRENIDFISNKDPAGYSTTGNKVWGKGQLGKIWFNTSTTRFLHYHQNDAVYDSKHWGQVFPGSEIAIYTWIESDVTPANYAGQGIPFDLTKYSISYHNDASENLVATYYYWVQNTNSVNTSIGKTLTDTVIQSYIQSPQSSGIAYMAPVKPNTFALYNSAEFIRGSSTNLLVNYSLSSSDSSNHIEFKLIRSNFNDDFLPGLPNKTKGYTQPYALYDRLIDSLSGTDEVGAVVPDPALPKMVQTGIGIRPRQSFFSNRFEALRNYIEYVNGILAQYPITEIQNLTFLSATGDHFTTADYWDFVNWWATGYSENTRTSYEVARYADLSAIENAYEGLVVSVTKNNQGKREIYAYTSGAWKRVGLEKGTIRVSDAIWNYESNKIGFGDNFYDSVSFDQYPSVETRYIIRSINEQIFKGELFQYRNAGLIKIFEYIQSENISNNNYLPWLTKTSLIDVGYTARKLETYQKYQRDNQTFLEGYVNEIKPYHVVIKDFFLRYEGLDTYDATFTDFDLPSKYNAIAGKFISPQLAFTSHDPKIEFLPTSSIWTDSDYSQWFANYGLILRESPDAEVAKLAEYISYNSTSISLDNARGLPAQGTLRIGTELINYLGVDRVTGRLIGVTRSVNASMGSSHLAGATVHMDLPSVNVLHTGRLYSQVPQVKALVDTTRYPAPVREAVLRAVLSDDKVIAVETIDPGEGYVVTPEIVFDYSLSFNETSTSVSLINNTLHLTTNKFIEGEIVKFATTSSGEKLIPDGYYYIHIVSSFLNNGVTPIQIVTVHTTLEDAKKGKNQLVFNSSIDSTYTYVIGLTAQAIPTMDNNRIRGLNTVLKFDRTSYSSKVKVWEPGKFWSSQYVDPHNVASSTEDINNTTATTSSEGTVINVVGVTDDGNDNTIVMLDFSDTLLKPGQITGAITHFYTQNVSYTFTDPVGGATIKISRPKFDLYKIVGSYEFFIDEGDGGADYTDGSTIIVLGSELGGVDGTNDAVITVDYVGLDGEILLASISGVPVANFHSYYLNPYTSTTAGVFSDPSMTIPVKTGKFTFDDGDFAYIPLPITAGPGYGSSVSSIVSYNNQLWRCIDSNNDQTFDLAKWEKLASDDASINALDRIAAYYSPTVGMPGKDFSQLVNGATFPYNTYIGNSFAPEDQYDEDYVIKDNPFYPTDLKIRGIVPHKTKDPYGNEFIDFYVAVADDTDKSVVLVGDETNWSVVTLAHTVLNVTGISYTKLSETEEVYVVTTNTKDIPLLVSYDINHWVTVGDVTSFDLVPWDIDSFAITGLGGNIGPLQESIGVGQNFFAVGNNIVKSTDGVNWTEVFTFGSALPNTIKDITYIDGAHYSGYIAVGYGDVVQQYPGSAAPVIGRTSRIISSPDGDVWSLNPVSFTNEELHFVFGTDTVIVTGGTNGTLWSMVNSSNWTGTTVDFTTTETLRDGAFGNDVFVVVGDSGTVLFSSDGADWTNATSSSTTTYDLYKITFDGNRFYAVGDMDTVLTSSDGETWINQSNVNIQDPAYTVKGAEFTFGYGPEELVAGLTNDNLVMRVTSIDELLETTFTIHVDKVGDSHVYRNNLNDNTVLTRTIHADATSIQVDDVSKLTGDLLVIGTEIIKFRSIDTETNTVSGLVRGALGTSPTAHKVNDVVYPLGTSNKLPDQYYNVIWNSRNEPIHGDPLTQSTTPAAIFLNTV